jgi:hypothetical protein
MQLDCNVFAFSANAFYYVAYAFDRKFSGHGNYGNCHIAQAKCLLATGTIKMNMLLFGQALALIIAQGVLQRAAAVVNGMQQAVSLKQG